MIKLVIVVVAYSRHLLLDRILAQLIQAVSASSIKPDIVISIDKSDNCQVRAVAEKHATLLGAKVIVRPEKLGLKKHILACGDLVENYDAILMLEDDLIISPETMRLGEDLIREYGDDPNIAQISLYSPVYNEATCRPFVAFGDGFDVYFAKYPSSWGQIWTKLQWLNFKGFLDTTEALEEDSHMLPRKISEWPTSTSWKKAFYKYIIANDLYVVYPRNGVTSNNGDCGTHYHEPTQMHTAHMSIIKRPLRLPKMNESCSVYDEYLEIEEKCLKRINYDLKKYDFDVDLYGDKPISILTKDYCLTSRPAKKYKIGYGICTYPVEANIFIGLAGKQILLCRPSDMITSRVSSADVFNARLCPSKSAVEQLLTSKKYIDNLTNYELIKEIARRIIRKKII